MEYGDDDGGRDDVSWSNVGEYLIWWPYHKNQTKQTDAQSRNFHQFYTLLLDMKNYYPEVQIVVLYIVLYCYVTTRSG